MGISTLVGVFFSSGTWNSVYKNSEYKSQTNKQKNDFDCNFVILIILIVILTKINFVCICFYETFLVIWIKTFV